MKTKVPHFLTAFLMLLAGISVSAQAPTLGTAANFVVFSTDGAVSCNTTNSLATHLTGNVGTNTSGGTSTGFGNVNGVMQDDNIVSQLASADLLIAYNQLNALIPNYFPSSLLGNGQSLNAGTYFINSGAVLDGNLIFNAQGDPNALFVIQIQGAFSTNALSEITLINGARACNVFWKVEGLVDMSTGTKMKGTIVANNAAILMAIDSTLEGRLLSTTGAVTVNGIVGQLPLGCGSAVLTGPIAPNLGSTVCYAIFSGAGDVTNVGTTMLVGDVGTNTGLTSGFNSLNVTGTIHPIPDVSTNLCAVDLLNVRTYLNALVADIELLYPAQFGNDLLLTPHTYLLNGATVLTNNLYLDGQNNSDAVFVIKIYGALSTSTYAKVILLNGAQAKNVYWIVNGAININDYSEFSGTIVGNNGAVNLSTGVEVDGRVLTTSGTFTTFAITDTVTAGCETLGIGDVQPINTKSLVYPNPFTTNLIVKVNEANVNSTFTLYDVMGKTILQKMITQTTTAIDVNVAPGMYFYSINTAAGTVETGKLISK
ncbi:ice-binding family protein [Flavobacterium antarcticum]|uniref:ice-binding family protein n=1 Tax=Flavobacterium antarcticum TaxID=271155 RepID=UPI0003B379B8|nr:ice-binding family protein [Flavobacterium antarcticum]